MRIPIVLILLAALLVTAGCTGVPPAAPATPTPAPEATTVAPTPTAEPTPEPEPFPDALPIGGEFRYGSEEDLREIEVYRAFTVATYWWHSDQTGSNWETKPQDAANNQFLFVQLKVKHLGTKKEIGAPHPTGCIVWYEGRQYPVWTGRDNDSPPIIDLGLPIDDYYGGILRKYETRDGFLIFEVPKTLTPGDAHLAIALGNQYDVPVWKLG
ncbi:MAG: hypothetical protein GKC04_01905 [Methanomicrobiales archaeon]|nr:hypothetical protein [Methanomicrobiales archaeon]